jgi:hypothetical protein
MLNGSIGTYAEQVLIATGRSDWKSRINEDEDAVFLRRLEGLLRRGGKYSDVRQRLQPQALAIPREAGFFHGVNCSVLIHFHSRITMFSSQIPRFRLRPRRPKARMTLHCQ